MTETKKAMGPEYARTPSFGWDEPAEIIRATKYLKTLDGDYIDGVSDLDVVIERVRSHGIAPDRAWSMMMKRWPILEREAPLREDLLRRIHHNYINGKKRPGYNAVGDDFEETRVPEFNIPGATIRRGSDITPKAIEWLWPERFPRGKLSLVAGFPDQGKTQVVMNICAKITTGGEWPNGEGQAPRGVIIYMSAEDEAEDTLIPRLTAAGADMGNVLIIESMVKHVEQGKIKNRVFNVEDDLRILTQAIEQERARGKIVRAVIFDPFNAYFGGAKKADSHNSADMRALLTPIAAWAAKMQVAVLGILHFNKADNSHTLYRVTGSISVAAAARAVWYCTKDPHAPSGRDQFVMVQGKHNLSKGKAGLSYQIDTRQVAPDIKAPYVEWLGATTVSTEDAFVIKRRDREAESVNEAKDMISKMLEKSPQLDGEAMRNIRAMAGVSQSTMQRARRELGLVCEKQKQFDGKWIYRKRTAVDDFADELAGDGDFDAGAGAEEFD